MEDVERRLDAIEERYTAIIERLDMVEEYSTELHDALIKEPLSGGSTLLHRLVRVVVFAENSSWAGKWVLRILLTLGAIFTSISVIKTGVGK